MVDFLRVEVSMIASHSGHTTRGTRRPQPSLFFDKSQYYCIKLNSVNTSDDHRIYKYFSFFAFLILTLPFFRLSKLFQ